MSSFALSQVNSFGKYNIPASKKKKVSSTWLKTMCLALVIIATLTCILLFVSSSSSKSIVWKLFEKESDALNMNHYKMLLTRAKELSEKYKQLTGVSSLPRDLQFLRPDYSSDEASKLRGEHPAGKTGDSKKGKETIRNRDLILGMAKDMDPKNMVVFFKSLRSVSNATVLIFVNEPIPDKHQQLAEASNIQLIGFLLAALKPPHLQSYHPSTLRWILFHNHLKENKEVLESHRRVWMIDVRDSYFQKDPFEFVSLSGEPSFHVFHGVEHIPLSECSWNAGWVRDCYGIDMLYTIGKANIICSGVSVGTTDTVVRYLAMMKDIVDGVDSFPDLDGKPVSDTIPLGNFPSCERNGVDQGVHNVLVHTGNILSLKQWTQRDGPVANMQSRIPRIDEHFSVRNGNDELYAVVHQYDRFPELQKFLFKKYVDWVDTDSFQSQWDYEEACNKYSFVEDIDLFKGVCDFKLQGGATTGASCCAICNRWDQCTAFTYLSGMCYLKKCSNTPSKGVTLSGAVSGFLK